MHRPLAVLALILSLSVTLWPPRAVALPDPAVLGAILSAAPARPQTASAPRAAVEGPVAPAAPVLRPRARDDDALAWRLARLRAILAGLADG